MISRVHTSCIVLGCVACDYTALSTVVGEHVVYHWDSSDNQLCGGTVAAADAFLEAMPAYYGLTFESGPNVEYFWNLRGLSNACAWGSAGACVIAPLSGFVLISDRPFDSHELAHTAAGGHGGPSFVDEGFAVRWQSELLGNNVWRTAPTFPSAPDLRTTLMSSNTEYAIAHTWWVALETNFGAVKMGEFIAALGDSASPEDVENALQRVLGISLAESAALAANLPEQLLDDPACELRGLPTLVWQGEALVIARGDALCDDADIVNLPGQKASWLFALEFPHDWVEINVTVTVPPGVDPQRKSLVLSWCDGKPELTNHMGADYFSATNTNTNTGDAMRYMSGRYVAALWGDLQADGTVELPNAEFAESSP